MANKRDFNVTNTKEVRQALSGLKESLKRKVMRKAVNEALSPVVKAAKVKARVFKRTGTLAKSIKKKTKTYPSGVTVGLAGPDKKTEGSFNGKPVKPNKTGHLVEYGTAPHNQPKAGRFRQGTQHPGAKAKSFLHASWRMVKSLTIGIITKRVKSELEKEVARAKRK